MVLSLGVEPKSSASEANALSIELRKHFFENPHLKLGSKKSIQNQKKNDTIDLGLC